MAAAASANCEALARLRAHLPDFTPRIAVLLGSGWGGLTRRLEDATRFSYAELPGFPVTGVDGHAGELWCGRLGSADVAVLAGRRHVYEDGRADGMHGALHALHAIGCRVLVQTNAAGSLDAALPPGGLMLISDHLNLAQRSPLVGAGGAQRFVDMVDAYDPALRRIAMDCAARHGITLREGVLAWVLGPQFETPAEIRMLRALGAQAVGMSTVPETILARHIGWRVLALSLVTNMAAGLSDEALSHAHTLAVAEAAAGQAGELLAQVVDAIAQSTRTGASP